MLISFGSRPNNRYHKQTREQQLVFSLAIGQEVKVEGRGFGHPQLRGGLGADLNTLEGLCPSDGLEMPCSAPGRAGGSGQVEGGLGFLTIDTVPLTRTKISRKISRYDIRLCNHDKS